MNESRLLVCEGVAEGTPSFSLAWVVQSGKLVPNLVIFVKGTATARVCFAASAATSLEAAALTTLAPVAASLFLELSRLFLRLCKCLFEILVFEVHVLLQFEDAFQVALERRHDVCVGGRSVPDRDRVATVLG